jgi:hypothetical protein
MTGWDEGSKVSASTVLARLSLREPTCRELQLLEPADLISGGDENRARGQRIAEGAQGLADEPWPERPVRRHVSSTDISTPWARAPAQVRLPP